MGGVHHTLKKMALVKRQNDDKRQKAQGATVFMRVEPRSIIFW